LDNPIGREEFYKFVNALAVPQPNKEAFRTISYYSKRAIEYASNLKDSITLVLIDPKTID